MCSCFCVLFIASPNAHCVTKHTTLKSVMLPKKETDVYGIHDLHILALNVYKDPMTMSFIRQLACGKDAYKPSNGWPAIDRLNVQSIALHYRLTKQKYQG